MVDSTAAWVPVIKPVKDAGRSQYWRYWQARGRRSGADQPDSSGTRGRGIDHLAAGFLVEPQHHVVHLRRGLLVARAARRPVDVADADLDVRGRGDAHVAAADLGDRLSGGHVRANGYERR